MSTVRPWPDQAIDARQLAPYLRAHDSLRPPPVDLSTMRSTPRARLYPRVRGWASDRSPRRTLLDLSGPTAGVRPLPPPRSGVTSPGASIGWGYQHNAGGPTNEPHVENVALAGRRHPNDSASPLPFRHQTRGCDVRSCRRFASPSDFGPNSLELTGVPSVGYREMRAIIRTPHLTAAITLHELPGVGDFDQLSQLLAGFAADWRG